MLKNRIIPCLDVKNGRVVKGINFVDLKDAGDPVEQAKIYSDGGADEICFLDITASNENRETIYDVVDRTSKKCFVPLTVGGGVRSVDDINKLLNCGADKVSINTAAVQNPEVIIESSKKFGSQCIVVAIDAKKNQDKWEIFTHGGRNNTGMDAIEFSKKMVKTVNPLRWVSCSRGARSAKLCARASNEVTVGRSRPSMPNRCLSGNAIAAIGSVASDFDFDLLTPINLFINPALPSRPVLIAISMLLPMHHGVLLVFAVSYQHQP